MKRNLSILLVLTFVILSLSGIQPVSLQAAAAYETVDPAFGSRTKAGTLYLYQEWTSAEKNTRSVYYAKSKSGKGKRIFTTAGESSSTVVVTNGSYIYYIKDNGTGTKHNIIRYNVSNGKSTTLYSIKTAADGFAGINHYYGGIIYYTVEDAGKQTLAAFTIKTKASKNLTTGATVEAASGRYLYLLKKNGSHAIYDLKGSKTVKTFAGEKDGFALQFIQLQENISTVYAVYQKSDWEYFNEEYIQNTTVRVYSYKLNGSGEQLVFEETGYGLSVYRMTSLSVYYKAVMDETNYYYRYSLNYKKTAVVSEAAFLGY